MKLKLFVLLIYAFNEVTSYNILVFVPFKSNSHHIAFVPLIEELTVRGHNVTVVSHFGQTTPLSNYTEILLSKSEISYSHFTNVEIFHENKLDGYNLYYGISLTARNFQKVFKMKSVKRLNETKYDLIITEVFNNEVFYGLFHKMNAPIIAFRTSDLFPWQSYQFSEPLDLYIPHALRRNLIPLTIWNRLTNMVDYLLIMLHHNLILLPHLQKVSENYIGETPNLSRIAGNVSLIFVNTHFSINSAKPRGPNIIEIGGIHIDKEKTLPKDIQELLDNSVNGVIYFSFGSTISGNKLSVEKQNYFLKAFSRLKQTVLWKIKTNFSIPKPKNVFTSDWYPQRDLLAHPNVVLFISQCGILSVMESVYTSVPIICIPLLGDQECSAEILKDRNIAKSLDFTQLSESSIYNAIMEIITDQKYKENMKKLSEIFKDRPISPMDTAVYWVEYVIRHNGPPFIKSLAKDLTWYEYHNLDIAVIFIVVLTVFIISAKLIIRIFYFNLVNFIKRKVLFCYKKIKTN